MRLEIAVTPEHHLGDRVDLDTTTVLDWLRDYVSAPSEHIGRSGLVCPFVPGALKAGAIRLSFHYGVDACDVSALHSLISAELHDFNRLTPAPRQAGISLDSVLVVLPDASEEGWRQIDESYSAIKDLAVRKGLMIGQFHPACAQGAVRNPDFPVSRSPIALYAIRHMAPHDALFLHTEQSWFRKYAARFDLHARRSGTDPLISELYHRAWNRYGDGT